MHQIVAGWLWNRAREGTTWVGMTLIAVSHVGLSSTDPSVQQFITMFNEYAPQIGAGLVAMSSKHP